jgi:hypothetical protein
VAAAERLTSWLSYSSARRLAEREQKKPQVTGTLNMNQRLKRLKLPMYNAHAHPSSRHITVLESLESLLAEQTPSELQ